MAEFDLTRIAPSDAAGRWVENYWVIEWDRGDRPIYRQENLPHPSPHLVLDPQAGSGLFGVQTNRFFYELGGKGRVIGAKFRPGQLYPLWQQSLAVLTDTHARDLDGLGMVLTALESEFVALEAPSDMARILDAQFAGLSVPPDERADLATQLVMQIEADPDLTSVAALAAQNGMSVRQMQRLFAQYVGVSPKWVIDRYRMIEAVEAISKAKRDH